ncbi:hypothetical protein [Corynebacterium glutamicum]|uniref:hypothetical protein n=1 Tax=Corynebacterium glutamicum TaxID=1718 RepID=UPI00155F33DF|nr:hypothetical protein [Corynebacterium glutamicum]
MRGQEIPSEEKLMLQIVFNITPEQERALKGLDSPHIRQGTGGVLFAVEVVDDSEVNAYTIAPDGTLISERLEELWSGLVPVLDRGARR